ncbi:MULTISPECIES: hypothetical protein [unclassified Streptomyces]|uniref:hypothetical protein n=1 Tax=unclassified Streptomyces TaxID=2593676 RepID=UPI0034414445
MLYVVGFLEGTGAHAYSLATGGLAAYSYAPTPVRLVALSDRPVKGNWTAVREKSRAFVPRAPEVRGRPRRLAVALGEAAVALVSQ